MDMSFKAPKGTVRPVNKTWMQRIFKATAVMKGGIVRRAKADVEYYGGYAALLALVEERQFHLIECGDQYIIICNSGDLRVIT